MTAKLLILDLQGTLVESIRPPILNGSPQSLSNIIAIGYTLAIFTGGAKTETLNILKKLQINQFFKSELIITKSKGFPPKPDPTGIKYLTNISNIKQTIFVGDTTKDQSCATNANIKFIRLYKNKFPSNLDKLATIL